MKQRYKGFGFIVFVSWRNRRPQKWEVATKDGIAVPIKNRRRLAKYLSQCAIHGYQVTKLEVVTWEQATLEGRNPWA